MFRIFERSLKFILPVFVILVGLSACATPRYYRSAELSSKLGCFRWFDPSSSDDTSEGYPQEYKRALARIDVSSGVPGDIPNENDREKIGPVKKKEDSLLRLAYNRINGIFAGSRGIYHNLFKDHYSPKVQPDGNGCSKDDETDDQVAISAFSTPIVAASASVATVGMDATLELPSKIVRSYYLYSIHPADRLDKVYALITPLEPGVEFISADGIDVKTQSIKYGTIQTNNGLNSSAIPYGTAFGQLLTATPSTISQNVSRDINRQFATQNTEIFPLRNVLLVSEDGGPSAADLSGNKSVTVTIRIPTGGRLCKYLGVYQLNGDGLSRNTVCHVDRIPALMGAIALERKVMWGGTTVDESDDDIKLVPFKSDVVFDLWVNPNNVYGIEYGTQTLKVKSKDKNEPLLFNNYANALNFLSWLEKQNLRTQCMVVKVKDSDPITACIDGVSEAKTASPIICTYRKHDSEYGPAIPQRGAEDYCQSAQ